MFADCWEFIPLYYSQLKCRSVVYIMFIWCRQSTKSRRQDPLGLLAVTPPFSLRRCKGSGKSTFDSTVKLKKNRLRPYGQLPLLFALRRCAIAPIKCPLANSVEDVAFRLWCALCTWDILACHLILWWSHGSDTTSFCCQSSGNISRSDKLTGKFRRVRFRVGNLGLMCTNGGLGPPVRGFPVLGEGGRTGKTGNKLVLISIPENTVGWCKLIVNQCIALQWSKKVCLCNYRDSGSFSVQTIVFTSMEWLHLKM